MQPDTIIPDPSNPQAWNRYSYVLNNPILYTDPTGHKLCDGKGTGGSCDEANPDDLLNWYDINTSGLSKKQKWDLADAATQADKKLSTSGYGTFQSRFGEINVSKDASRDNCETVQSTITCGSVALYKNAFLHEFGHVLQNQILVLHPDRSAGDLDSYPNSTGKLIDDCGGYWCRTTLGFQCEDWRCLEHPQSLDSNQTDGNAKNEQWADLFMNWILDDTDDPFHGFTNDPNGNARRKFMGQQFYWLFTGRYCPSPNGLSCP